jgi:hypothetical protein
VNDRALSGDIVEIELTLFAKHDGALTKRIVLGTDGKPVSDGSECVMVRGTAARLRLQGLHAAAQCIDALGPDQAIALGSLRGDLPDSAEVVPVAKLNGAAAIARTTNFISFRPGRAALVLIDFDMKGMPEHVRVRLDGLGGLHAALHSVVPELAAAGCITRLSISAGLYRADTGERFPGSGGSHLYIPVLDGADIIRFLKLLHERCWLAGLGWLMVGCAGQLLERSIVDRMVGSPERLIFEGDPVLAPPLAQDKAIRRSLLVEGAPLDTIAACPPLSIVEHAKLRELHAKEAYRLTAEVAKAREAFVSRQSQRLALRAGMDVPRARRTIESQCDGVLLPDVVLPFDDAEYAGSTVAHVLADPARFEGATLADPLEGSGYGRCKARIMLRRDGAPWIHSFAHGRTVYELRFDYRAAKTALEAAAPDQAADLFVSYVLAGNLGADEVEQLRDIASSRSGVNKRTLERKLKDERDEAAKIDARQERERRRAERQDPRPQIQSPSPDAEWLPQMGVINEILGRSAAPEPPMRNIDGCIVEVSEKSIPSLHLLTSSEKQDERMPAPER